MPTIELMGVVAIIAMVASYALEDRHPVFILIFALSCTVAAIYAFLIQSYPFLLAEGVWSVIAAWRYRNKIVLG